MKNRTIYIIAYIFLAGFSACKKDCDKNYTISGTIINGTSDKPYSDTLIVMRVSEEKNFGGTNSALLASGYTNSNGEFTLTYKCTDIDGDIQFLMGNWETSLPKNQDITDKILYFSDSATVKVTFKTNTPLKSSNDSLYWEYAHVGSDIVLDTIVGPQPNSFTRTLRVKPSRIQFLYGRTYEILRSKNKVDYSVGLAGDPYINEVTIEY